MKTMFGKKETSKPSTGEADLHFSGRESAGKQSEGLNRPNSPEKSFPAKVTSGNLKTFDLHFDNPDFGEHHSNIFSLSGDRNSIISTTKSASGSFRQRKNASDSLQLDNAGSLGEVFARKSKSHLDQKSEKRSKSHDSLTRLSENLMLRKTEEISDFKFENFNEINMIKDNSPQRAVERFALSNEKRERRSDLCESATTVTLFNEIDLSVTDSGDCKKKSEKALHCAPFRLRRGVKKSPDENRKEKENGGFWSKKSYFNKMHFVNFLLEKNEKTSKSNVFRELSKTEKGDIKPNVLRERFVNPKVSLKEDLETKQYFKDLLFYTVYLVLLTTIALSMVSSSMYYFTNITASLFLDTENTPSSNNGSGDSFPRPPNKESKYGHERTLRKSHTFHDFWSFAESTMMDLLYWKFYYNKIDDAEANYKKMLYENQILGVPRLRQVRVRGDSCSVHPDVKRFFNKCYNYYSPFTEETDPIKEGMESSSTGTAWVYTKAEKLKSSYYWGEISVYGGGGYYLDLDVNEEKSREMIKELKENDWLSRATRAIFIDFSIYNANVNLFCLCKIVLEFPPVGGIIPKADFQTLKLIRYLTTFDFFILGCEFLLILFMLYFTWKLLKNLAEQKTYFFLYFWNYLDLTIVSLMYVFITLNIIRYCNSDKLIKTLDDRPYEYTEFGFLRDIQIHFNNVVAGLLFVSWIKLFKYLTFNKMLVEFRKTLHRSLIGIWGFFPIFLTMYLAYAFVANLLFGNEIKEYSTVWLSILSLHQAFLGGFQYKEIQESHRVLGPIFYLAFIFFILFVLLNVFVAIVNYAYAKVKSEMILMRPKVGEYAKTGILNLMTCCQLRKKLKKKTSVKKKIIFNEIKRALENAGFSKDEIRLFFSKYNINVNNIIDKNTRRKVIEDLELKRVDFEDSERQSQINFLKRKMDKLMSRIDDMEVHLRPVIDKVDVLLDRFSSKKYS